MPDALSEKYESRIEAETIWFYVTLRQNSVVIKQQYKLTLAPRKRASSSSCLRGSSAAWKCSILTPAPVEDGACYNPCIKKHTDVVHNVRACDMNMEQIVNASQLKLSHYVSRTKRALFYKIKQKCLSAHGQF